MCALIFSGLLGDQSLNGCFCFPGNGPGTGNWARPPPLAQTARPAFCWRCEARGRGFLLRSPAAAACRPDSQQRVGGVGNTLARLANTFKPMGRPPAAPAPRPRLRVFPGRTTPRLSLPPTASWVAPPLHLRLVATLLPDHLGAWAALPPPPSRRRRQSGPGQVSYLHHAAPAKPILREDGDPNVTNPSVPV